MTKTRICLCVVLAAIALVGCGKKERKADVSRTALSPEEAREICLSAPKDNSSVGQTIRDHQNRARRIPGKPDEWILVGRGWVREARASADPGFYVNVEACATAAL